MTTEQYISFREAIRSAIASCLGARGTCAPHDVLLILKEKHAFALAAVQERMADIGTTAEIRRFLKKPPLIDAAVQLAFLPESLRRLSLSPSICCPPEDTDLDEEEEWGRFPWVPLAQVNHARHARYLDLLTRSIARDQRRLQAHQTLHTVLTPYVVGDEPYAEVCKLLPAETRALMEVP